MKIRIGLALCLLVLVACNSVDVRTDIGSVSPKEAKFQAAQLKSTLDEDADKPNSMADEETGEEESSMIVGEEAGEEKPDTMSDEDAGEGEEAEVETEKPDTMADENTEEVETEEPTDQPSTMADEGGEEVEAEQTEKTEDEVTGEHLICRIVDRNYKPTTSEGHYLLLEGYSLKENTNDANKKVERYTLPATTKKNTMACTMFGMNPDIHTIEVIGAQVDRSDLDANGAYVIVDCDHAQQYVSSRMLK